MSTMREPSPDNISIAARDARRSRIDDSVRVSIAGVARAAACLAVVLGLAASALLYSSTPRWLVSFVGGIAIGCVISAVGAFFLGDRLAVKLVSRILADEDETPAIEGSSQGTIRHDFPARGLSTLPRSDIYERLGRRRPTVLSGAAQAFDLFGLLVDRTPPLSPEEKMRRRWEHIGDRMRESMERFELEHAEELAKAKRRKEHEPAAS